MVIVIVDCARLRPFYPVTTDYIYTELKEAYEEWESDERNTLEIEAGQEPAQFTPVIYTPRQLRLTAELETLRETLGVEIIVRRMGGMFA